MVLPGHLAGGYLAAATLLSVLHPDFSTTQINTLLLIGTLAGELPDIDLFFFNWKHRKDTVVENNSNDNESHRNYITHVPLFWLLISLIIILSGYALNLVSINSTFIQWTGWIILIGTWSHLILDSIEYGIRWLSPISKKRYALKTKIVQEKIVGKSGSLLQYFHYLIKIYWKSWTFPLEILISMIAIAVFLNSF